MVDISKLSDQEKVQLIDNRWKESATLWSVVETAYRQNKKQWENLPNWLEDVPRKKSKARDNRSFLAMESVINSLTGRPSKPNVVPANESDEAKQLANDLQDVFLDKYRTLGIKEKMRRALRLLFLARVFCLKIYWSEEDDDFNVCPIDPRFIRISPKATGMYDTEYVIEKVEDKPLLEVIELFPNKKDKLLKIFGSNEKRVYIENPRVPYREFWMGEYCIYECNGEILETEKHPYWDFDGLLVTPNEKFQIDKVGGGYRNSALQRADKNKDRRNKADRYEQYLYNYLEKAMPPYIFGTVLALGDKPVGDSSLLEQVIPLQEEIDKRKRQISDNAEMMNGRWKIDTNFVTASDNDIQRMMNTSRGFIKGKGVSQGVILETGKELPSFIMNDMSHSVIELDNIFGTQPTFRGEGGQSETATGRAILREQSFSRLDELIDFVDKMHLHLYSWMMQMMQVKYTESHMVKVVGIDKSARIIELSRNDIQQGTEVRIIPGQVVPEDRLFQMERAKEEAQAGLIDPLTYFEETQRDNPQELAKRIEMYKINPFSIITLSQEDMQAIQQANQLFTAPQATEGNRRAGEVAAVRQQAEQLMQTPEFQNLPEEEKKQAMQQIRQQLERVTNAK